MVELLIAKGAKVKDTDSQKLTALHFAAEHNQKEFVQLLLLRGAGPQAKDKKKRTPADLAKTEEIRSLLAGKK